MLSPEPAKTLDESRIFAALETETPIEEVKYDEVDEPTDLTNKDSKRKPFHEMRRCQGRRRTVWGISLSVLVVGLVIATSLLAIFLQQKESSQTSDNTTNSSFDLEQFAKNHIPAYSWEAAQIGNSPQAQALAFINATASLYPTYRLQQRYSLAVLHYSTSFSARDGTGPKEENECEWFWYPGGNAILEATWSEDRSKCTNDSRYLILGLEDAALNGTIPKELEMLSDLRYLNFAKNFLTGPVPSEL
jgi:hypothetical protein